MSAFNASQLYGNVDTVEKVLMQLLLALHFIASGERFKLREATSVEDTGNVPYISRQGPYQAKDGQTVITFVVHLPVQDDVESSAYANIHEACKEITTAPLAATYVA